MTMRWLVIAITVAFAASLSASAAIAAPKKKFRAVQTWRQGYTEGWALDRINQKSIKLDGVTVSGSGAGAGITIYVIDTGIGADDCNGHGTVVASMISGDVYGVASGSETVSVKALDCAGFGTANDVINAINWVKDNANPSTSIVNMSLGGLPNTAVDSAVAKLAALMPVVVAAGNSSTSACNSSPARVANAITVAAYDQYNMRSIFSNFGSCVDVWAPGTAIDGIDKNGNRVQWSGTSMSTALVSGSIAYIADRNGMTTLQAASKMMQDASRPYLVDARLSGTAAYAVWIRN